jgi:hypothetical protein
VGFIVLFLVIGGREEGREGGREGGRGGCTWRRKLDEILMACMRTLGGGGNAWTIKEKEGKRIRKEGSD